MVASLFLVACGAQPAPEPAPATEKPAPAKTLRVGAALSETGKYATVGQHVRQGYDLWADYVNNELGGIDIGGNSTQSN